jgi:hypothetical protein
MFGNDALNPVANSTHRFSNLLFKGAESGYFARFTKSIKASTGATLQREIAAHGALAAVASCQGRKTKAPASFRFRPG